MRLSRYAFLTLVAFVAHPAFARCEFKDSRQQQQCIQQEQAQLRAQQQRQQEQQRQQQVAQQQRQQQAQQQAQQRAQEQQRQQQVQRQQQEQSRRAQEQQRQQLEAQQRAQESQRQRQAAQQQAQQRQVQQQREAQIHQQQQQAQQQRQQQLQLQQAERQRQAQQQDRQEAQRRAQEQTRQADLRRQQQNAERQHREDLVRAQAERQRRDDAQRRIEQDRQREQERRNAAQHEEQQRNAEIARQQKQAQTARDEAQRREQQRRDQEAQAKREREHQARAPATPASGCSEKHGRAHEQCLAERERARQDTRAREAQQREAQQRAQREQQQEASARQQALQQQQRDAQLRQQQTQQAQQQARQQPDRQLATDHSAAVRKNSSQVSNRAGLPLAQELQKIPLDQLASMPKDQLANLPPDRQRNLNNYVAAKANAAKYEAEANKSIASRFVKELPRQTANVTAGAVVGAGQVAVETGKAAFQAGQRVGTPIGNAVGTVVGDALFDPKALPSDIRGGAKRVSEEVRRDTAKVIQKGVEVYQNPQKSAKEVGAAARNVVTQAKQAVSTGASNYAEAIKRGDGYEAGRIGGRTTATAGLIVGGGTSGKAVTRGERLVTQESKRITATGAEQQTARQIVVEKSASSHVSTTAEDKLVSRSDKVSRLEPNNPKSTSLPRQGNRLVLNQGNLPTCGAVSCAMVLDTAGKKIDVQKLILDSNTRVGLTGQQGATINNLRTALQKNGVPDARVVRGMSVEQLAEATSKGKPAIVAVEVDRGAGVAGHAVVVDGITIRQGQEVVAIRDPALGRQYFTPVEEFRAKFKGDAILTNY